MTLWLMLAGSLALAVVVPLLLAPWLGDRNRLLGFSLGGYLVALGSVFLFGTSYVAVSSGQVGISMKGAGGVVMFSDGPVVASLLLLVNFACAAVLVALGWLSIRHSRGRVDAAIFEAPSAFSAEERAAVEPEARRLLEARFPGLGRIQAPHFDSLLQVQIEEILRHATRVQADP